MSANDPMRTFIINDKYMNIAISIKTVIALSLCVLITSCSTSSTSFKQYKHDSTTGNSETKVYTRYLNGRTSIIKDELTIEGAVELHDEVIDNNNMGKVLSGTLELFLYNKTGKAKTIYIHELDVDSTEGFIKTFNTKIGKTLNLPAMSIDQNTRIKADVGSIPVSQYETKLIVTINAKYKDKEVPISLEVNRLTSKELHKLIHAK